MRDGNQRRALTLMSTATTFVVLLGLAFSAGAVAAADASGAAISFSGCSAKQNLAMASGVQCGTLDVPLSRQDPSLGTVALAVQRVPASAPQVGTIVLLAGGPGQAALLPFEVLLAPLAKTPSLRGYELVSFDQRGTGQSGALECRGLLTSGLSALGRCGEMLGSARADYTSQDSVEDIDALRQGLGGSPISLYGVSYGGKVAAMYAHEHPTGISRMVLDSPVPLAGSDALDSQRPRALPRVLNQAICAGGACRSFAHDPYDDLVRLLSAVRAHPVRARIFDGSGRPTSVPVTEKGIYRLLSVIDLSPILAGIVPAAIADAVHGRYAPLARMTNELTPATPASEAALSMANELMPATPASEAALSMTEGLTGASEAAEDQSLSLPLLSATLCTESALPWTPESAVATRAQTLRDWVSRLPAGYTAPFTPAVAGGESAVAFCKGWPPTQAAPAPPTGESATPTLILSGDEDLREPYEQDLAVAAGYSDVQLLRIPGTGHSTVSSDRSGCAQHAMVAFLTSQATPSICPAPAGSEALAPPPSSLSDVRSAGSHATLVARVLSAAMQTIREVLSQPDPAGGGGLHGGFWRLRRGQLMFHRLVDIPGVSLSGSIPLTKLTAHLKVNGRVVGTLKLRDGAILIGHLDGSVAHIRL